MQNKVTSLLSTDAVIDSDLFVTAQQDKYVCNRFNSRSTNGESLFSMLAQKVRNIRNFTDSAYMTSSEFSKYDHHHDNLYNKLSIDFRYTSQSSYRRLSSFFKTQQISPEILPDDKSLSIGNVFIDGTLAPIEVTISSIRRVKKISFTPVEPNVGALKFVPTTTIGSNSSINYKSIDFDGWLYPDGSTFNLADFSLSSQLRDLYGSRYSSKFTLPDLRSFIKLNGNNIFAGSSLIGMMPGQNVLFPHVHALDGTVYIAAQIIVRLIAGIEENGIPGTTGPRGIFYGCSKAAITYTGEKKLPYIHKNGNLVFGNLTNLYNWVFPGNTGSDSMIYPWPAWNSGGARLQLSRGGMNAIFSKLREINGKANIQGITVNTDYDSYASTFYSTSQIYLPSINDFTATVNIGGSKNVTLQYINGDTGETYPEHVILPVMIYVGQKRRTYYEQ